MPFEYDRSTAPDEASPTGVRVEGDDRAVVRGRPVGVAFPPSGTPPVADGTGGTTRRVTPTGAAAA